MGRCAASESGRLLVDLRAGLVEIPSRTVSDRWSPGSCVLDTMDERPGPAHPAPDSYRFRVDDGSPWPDSPRLCRCGSCVVSARAIGAGASCRALRHAWRSSLTPAHRYGVEA